uniref:UCH37-like C-terminal domain-containing protein n=1 Tax=Molossus molossus TaxID=27622 RepID=A0A7J8FYX6_MOLMO|nr:hypothetical protein HJG59_008184 [Molossus molossus]
MSDRKMIYEQKIAELQRQLAEEEPMDTEQGNMLSAIQSEVAKKQMLIEEVQKLKRYKIENIRRKHKYLPFIMELLKTLAEHQQLTPLVEKAKENRMQRKHKKPNEEDASAGAHTSASASIFMETIKYEERWAAPRLTQCTLGSSPSLSCLMHGFLDTTACTVCMSCL